MDDLRISIWKSLKPVVSDSSFLQLIGSIAIFITVLVTKKLREYLRGVFDAARNYIKGNTAQHTITPADTRVWDNINSKLIELRVNSRADRVAIYQFHNGDSFTLSNPIFKITCSYEQVRQGLTFDAAWIKYSLASNFIDLIGPLMDTSRKTPGVKDLYSCEKFEILDSCEVLKQPLRLLKFDIEAMPYSNYKYIMQEQGVNTVYACMLYSTDRQHPIGILCTQYIDELSHDKFFKNSVCKICAVATEVQHQLCSAKKSLANRR